MFCEKDVTQEEIHKVIKLLKNNKSPGDDGIIAEFYQNFWYLIHDELTQVIKFALENKSLSKSQYNAIITLLYKKGRSGRNNQLAAYFTNEYGLQNNYENPC